MNRVAASGDPTNRPAGRWTLRLAHLVLGTVMLLAWGLLTASFSWPRFGSTGVIASLAAAAVCWGGAALAMSAPRLFSANDNVLAITVLGMAFRMGMPLVAVVVVVLQGGPLAESGFVVCVLAYYATALVVETWLSLRLMSSARLVEAR